MNTATAMVSGLIVAGYMVIGLFFLRFRRQAHDPLFGYFAAAFWLLALQRGLLTFLAGDDRATLLLYSLRALAFLIIIYAIIDKNRADRA